MQNGTDRTERCIPICRHGHIILTDILLEDYDRLENRPSEERGMHVCAVKDKASRFVRHKDRRIQKTQNLLREALVSLIREKPYDAIAVTEILQRANVGRSTFYTHFQHKDDLLASGIHDMLRPAQSAAASSSAKPPEGIIWFSLPIFEFLDRHRRTGETGMGARSQAIIHERLRRVLAESIADNVRKACHGRRKIARQIPPDLLAQHVASTFILVLNWWVESRSPLPPNEVNDLFRALILPTLVATLG